MNMEYLPDTAIKEFGLTKEGHYLCVDGEKVYFIVKATLDGLYVREVNNGRTK